MAITKLCKLYYGSDLSSLLIRHTATESASLAFTIKDTATSTTLVSDTILHDTSTDLVPIMWVNGAVNGTEYDLYVDDTVPVINLSCNSILNQNISSYVEFYPTHPILINLTTFICNYNHLLTTGLTFPDFANALNLVNVNNNQLTSATLDAIILKVWSNAITNLQVSKAFNVSGNAGTPSAQSQAYLAALMDDASFNWTINGSTTRTAWTITNNAADLQLAAINLTSNIKLGQHIEGAVTHDWGSVVPDYTLVIPSGTIANLSAVANGSITIGEATRTVCGVYFNASKVLNGFYVTGSDAASGAISQGTFTATGCSSCTIKHFYRDLPASVYATEKAKILAGTLYDLTDDTQVQPLVYNDKMSRIYYRGQAIPEDGVAAKTGFVPIGQATAFKGNFDCNGYELRDFHVCSNLQNVGIIGYQDGVNSSAKKTTIKSVGHTIIGFGYTATIGKIGLIGYNYRYRIINDSYSTGSVNGTGNSDTRIGGIVGWNDYYSQVNNSYSTGSVNGTGNSSTNIGGLVGWNYSSSQVNNSYSTGSVNGTGNIDTHIGGLVGLNYSSSQVNNSYSTGSVNGTGNGNTYIGGLVGWNHTSSQVKNCFGYGDVIAYNGATPLDVKGIYYNSNSSIINCYQLGAVTPNLGETSLDKAGFRVKSNFAVQTSLYSTPHDPEATYAINAHVNSGGKCYVCIKAAPIGTPITDTAYWLEDTGFDFVGTWRMGKDYPKLRVFLNWIKNRTNRTIKHLYFGA